MKRVWGMADKTDRQGGEGQVKLKCTGGERSGEKLRLRSAGEVISGRGKAEVSEMT